jgi:hypothetical protein
MSQSARAGTHSALARNTMISHVHQSSSFMASYEALVQKNDMMASETAQVEADQRECDAQILVQNQKQGALEERVANAQSEHDKEVSKWKAQVTQTRRAIYHSR